MDFLFEKFEKNLNTNGVIVSDNLESNQIVSVKIDRVDENNLVYGSVIL